MERPSVELAVIFVVGATMNEHLKRKHPVETDQAPKLKQLKLDTYTVRKTGEIFTLVTAMIVRDLCPLNT